MFFINGGGVGWDYTGVKYCEELDAWLYVENGKVNWSFTGVVIEPDSGEGFFINGGGVGWNYTGTYTNEDGTVYNIEEGRVQ